MSCATSPASAASAANPRETVPLPSTFEDGLPLPDMVVFDLDYTLWPLRIQSDVKPPLKAMDDMLGVKDQRGERFAFYTEVNDVLVAARQKGIKLAIASHTQASDVARDMLKLLRVPHPSSSNADSVGAMELFDYLQILPEDKKSHFETLQSQSGIRYENMLFFDDKVGNGNVEDLGVVMWHAKDGITRKVVDQGINDWRNRSKKE